MKERKGVDPNEWEDGKKPERIEGAETIIRIKYVRRKRSIFNKRKKR